MSQEVLPLPCWLVGFDNVKRFYFIMEGRMSSGAPEGKQAVFLPDRGQTVNVPVGRVYPTKAAAEKRRLECERG